MKRTIAFAAALAFSASAAAHHSAAIFNFRAPVTKTGTVMDALFWLRQLAVDRRREGYARLELRRPQRIELLPRGLYPRVGKGGGQDHHHIRPDARRKRRWLHRRVHHGRRGKGRLHATTVKRLKRFTFRYC